MIQVIVPNENNYLPLKYIYDQYKEQINGAEFRDIAGNCPFFFFEDENFIGFIYYYRKQGLLYVDVFATRGHHLLNLHIFKQTLKLVNEPVYAECLSKTSLYGALRCGFKKYKDNIYIYKGE